MAARASNRKRRQTCLWFGRAVFKDREWRPRIEGVKRLHRELGKTQAEPYKTGLAGVLARLAGTLNIAGAIATARGGGLAKAGGAMLLAGGLAERFAVYHAGKQSAEDPKYVIEAQTTHKRRLVGSDSGEPFAVDREI